MISHPRVRILVRLLIPAVVCLLLVFAWPQSLFSWGFWAHREITKVALESLPDPLGTFFKAHADSLIAKSIEPDQRRFADPEEGFTHYIDIDRYGKYPFGEFPRAYDEAVKKYGRKTVDSNGTVPWRIASYVKKLSSALRLGNADSIITFASHLGHYIADAHVPLHATENYDGQLTDQRGLHARWESRIPEKFGATFNLAHHQPEYLQDPLSTAFETILESYREVDSVLSLDKQLQQSIPENERMIVRKSNGRTTYEYTDRYYAEYYALLNGMVERRMNRAIERVADYWYTAWVDAGKPEIKQ